MDTAQWPQEIVVKPMEEMIVHNTCSSSVTAANSNSNNNNNKTCSTALERKVRPQKDQAVNCPRCNSTNTKFCYYNNYSLTQPRYFCKTCRRYWTEGGSLRNIPVGGGSRKNKRSSSSSSASSISSSSTSSASKKLSHHDHHHLVASPFNPNPNPNPSPKNMNIHHQDQGQGQDLNLGFPPTHQDQFRSLSEFIQLPAIETTQKSHIPNSTAAGSNHISALELLNGFTCSSRGLTPFMPMPVPDPNAAHVYSSGFSLQDFKPTLSFSLDHGIGNGYGSLQGGVQVQQQETNNGRILFPFEDLKQVSSNTSPHHADTTTANEQTREQGDSSGYWSGMLGTGGSW